MRLNMQTKLGCVERFSRTARSKLTSKVCSSNSRGVERARGHRHEDTVSRGLRTMNHKDCTVTKISVSDLGGETNNPPMPFLYALISLSHLRLSDKPD